LRYQLNRAPVVPEQGLQLAQAEPRQAVLVLDNNQTDVLFRTQC